MIHFSFKLLLRYICGKFYSYCYKFIALVVSIYTSKFVKLYFRSKLNGLKGFFVWFSALCVCAHVYAHVCLLVSVQ